MNHRINAPGARGWFRARGHSSRGSAVLIVLILMTVAAVLVLSNTVALRRLNRELQILEQKQRRVAAEVYTGQQPRGP